MVQKTPLSMYACAAWRASTGRGVQELSPQYSPSTFACLITSPFTERRVPVQTRTFVVDTCRIHTAGRRPSVATIRTLRATAAVLTHFFGTYPQRKPLEVMLSDDPEPKSLPDHGPIAAKHVNSGFSTRSRIVIARCSEMHRTIIHEMLHVWRVHGCDWPAAQELAKRTLRAPLACLLTESFVEALAWLIHGGFCAKGLDPHSALSTAKSYLDMRDTGSSNAWAYIVGKALLIEDGGLLLFNTFVSPCRRLFSEPDHLLLVHIMQQSARRLGGADLGRVSPLCHKHLIYCACSLGPAYRPDH